MNRTRAIATMVYNYLADPGHWMQGDYFFPRHLTDWDKPVGLLHAAQSSDVTKVCLVGGLARFSDTHEEFREEYGSIQDFLRGYVNMGPEGYNDSVTHAKIMSMLGAFLEWLKAQEDPQSQAAAVSAEAEDAILVGYPL